MQYDFMQIRSFINIRPLINKSQQFYFELSLIEPKISVKNGKMQKL